MTLGFVHDVPTLQLADIVAGLVRNGLTFKVHPVDDTGRYWTIELTGGY